MFPDFKTLSELVLVVPVWIYPLHQHQDSLVKCAIQAHADQEEVASLQDRK